MSIRLLLYVGIVKLLSLRLYVVSLMLRKLPDRRISGTPRLFGERRLKKRRLCRRTVHVAVEVRRAQRLGHADDAGSDVLRAHGGDGGGAQVVAVVAVMPIKAAAKS